MTTEKADNDSWVWRNLPDKERERLGSLTEGHHRCIRTLVAIDRPYNLHISRPRKNRGFKFLPHDRLEVKFIGTMSTFDCNRLSLLVKAAHAHKVRVELSPCKATVRDDDGRKFKVPAIRIALNARKSEGDLFERHPGLEVFASADAGRRTSLDPAQPPPVGSTVQARTWAEGWTVTIAEVKGSSFRLKGRDGWILWNAELWSIVALPDGTTDHWQIQFERVGRNSAVFPLNVLKQSTLEADAEHIAEAVHAAAKPHLRSPWFDVIVDMETMEGWIDGGRFGKFTIVEAETQKGG